MNVKNIVLDFGHGGIDSNGKYTTKGKKHIFENGDIAYEGVLNREIGLKIKQKLEVDNSLNVITTVSADNSDDMPLKERVSIANKYDPKTTILVSIHSNAFNGKARGFEIFTTKGVTNSDALAEYIANEVEYLYKSINLNLRFDNSDGDKDKESDFYVLRKSACPAVLLECLFFDNREDFEFLRNDEFQNDLAKCISKGILNFVYRNNIKNQKLSKIKQLIEH